jgi:hypothetical protein
MTRPVVYSASSVNSYLDCHLKWWFTYVLNEPGEQSEAQAVGIAIHDYAEHQLRRYLSNPVEMLATPYLAPTGIEPLAMVFNRDILPTYRNPVLIEAPFQIEVEGIPFSGIIDSVDEQDVPWGFEKILRDLKSTGSKPKPGRYVFNMRGYWLGARDLGHEPAAIQLDYIVRTKEPYYWPEVQPIPDDDDLAAFASTLYGVANAIERSDYRATGLGTRACSSCSYTAICGPYKRFKEVTDG